MIIILTGGTPESNDALLEKLSFPYTLITGPSFATQRSILQSKLPSKNHFIIPCALKSHRYEIHCIARRFNHSFHILLDTTKTDNYEELNGTNDKPIICDYEIEKLKDHDTSYMNKAHTKKTVSGDYMQKVKRIINTVNQKYNCVFVKECEKRMYNMVNKSVIDIDDIEKVYESMILESQNK